MALAGALCRTLLAVTGAIDQPVDDYITHARLGKAA